MSSVLLTIEWEDGGSTLKEFPSKADAIDWLATNETSRPMATVTMVPIASRSLP